MSSTPTSTVCFSIPLISVASRLAKGTPRRCTPTRPRFSAPLFFSIISWARRTRVRSISEADRIRPFSRRTGLELVCESVIRLLRDDTRCWRCGASNPWMNCASGIDGEPAACAQNARTQYSTDGRKGNHHDCGKRRHEQNNGRVPIRRKPEVNKPRYLLRRLGILMDHLVRHLRRQGDQLLIDRRAMMQTIALKDHAQAIHCAG